MNAILNTARALAKEKPLDPPPEMSDDEAGIRQSITDAEERIGRAERALAAGDIQAAIDHLHCAGADLCNADWSA